MVFNALWYYMSLTNQDFSKILTEMEPGDISLEAEILCQKINLSSLIYKKYYKWKNIIGSILNSVWQKSGIQFWQF